MPFIPPREVHFPLFFFKSLAGIGIGSIGMLILLIFVLLGVDTFGSQGVSGPFLTFATVVMGLITALITNCFGVFIFAIIDREKYADTRKVLMNIISLNILIFLFLLPAHFLAVISSGEDLRLVMLVATIQLVASAFASMFILELSNSQGSRQNLITIYGIVFAILATLVANALIYQLGQAASTTAELATGSGGGKGITIILFAILPTIWFFFGAFTTMIEMLYHWIYQTWGQDPLND
ncbi:MAG: hypothetical protein WCV72_02120 [Patescibacteria group bacterium]|jgi:hypothetical protein